MSAVIPHIVFVTGPRSTGRNHWLETQIDRVLLEQPGARCAVVLADEGLTGTARFNGCARNVDVRCVFMPCLCCPAAAELPRIVREFAETRRPDWLFIEVPVLAAVNLIGEFDHTLRWPREVVVRLNAAWAHAQRRQTLSPFQARLLDIADRTIEADPRCNASARAVPALTLT